MKRFLLLTLFSLLVILQYRLLVGEGSIPSVIKMQNAIGSERQGLEKLVLRNLRLDNEVQALKAHPEALEERARSELGMIKEGETFCLVIEPGR